MDTKIDFLALYEEIYRLMPQGNLQDLMDVCYKVTNIPILIVDITYNVLGISPNKPTGDYLWDYLLQHRGYESDKIEITLKDGIIKSVDMNKAPYVIDWGSQKGHPKIQGIVRINNNVEAYVTMNCSGSVVTDDKLKAMEIIQSVCTYFFKGRESEGNMSHTYQKVFMTELMNDKIQSSDQLYRWFADMNFQPKPPYLIAAVSAYEENGRLVLSLIRKSIQSLQHSKLMLIRNNILYILYFEYDNKLPLSKSFNDILQRYDGHCGISMTFDNLLQFSCHREQAYMALSVGEAIHNPGRLYLYQELMLPALFIDKVKALPKENYIPRVLFDIKRYDDENSTEFLLTVRTYILCLHNTTDTASKLHIHRNTLLYRLNKIEELFNISLKDSNLCFHFLTAFYMLELENKLST